MVIVTFFLLILPALIFFSIYIPTNNVSIFFSLIYKYKPKYIEKKTKKSYGFKFSLQNI